MHNNPQHKTKHHNTKTTIHIKKPTKTNKYNITTKTNKHKHNQHIIQTQNKKPNNTNTK